MFLLSQVVGTLNSAFIAMTICSASTNAALTQSRKAIRSPAAAHHPHIRYFILPR
jgi:hypothetical protein